MSTPTGVDRDAPVLAHHEVDIDAPLDTVWELHLDVNAWPGWQPDLTAAHLEGVTERGVSFDWTRFWLQRHVDRLRRGRASPCAVGWNGRRLTGGARVAFQ